MKSKVVAILETRTGAATSPNWSSAAATETVLAALAEVDVQGSTILVQRYGETNRALLAGLNGRGQECRK